MITELTLSNLQKRPRRNRRTPAIRGLVQETHLHASQLIAPLFILEGADRQEEIQSMPGVYRLSVDNLIEEAKSLYEKGIRAVDLFCYTSKESKNSQATEATRPGNLMQQALWALKKELPDLCLMVDVALDPFTDHGHDGIVNTAGEIDNELTLPILAQMSVLAAEAGADIVAPSDMMDGRVACIRQALDLEGHTHVGILSYTAKYASAFYGPFRDALHSAPQFGDKKTYQMNPANAREALLECCLDEEEGADMILVKPALPYLDIIAKIKEITNLPVGAYHVSGEYAMVMAAAQKGWLDATRVFEESLLSIRRAGADFILTYAAGHIASHLKKKYT